MLTTPNEPIGNIDLHSKIKEWSEFVVLFTKYGLLLTKNKVRSNQTLVNDTHTHQSAISLIRGPYPWGPFKNPEKGKRRDSARPVCGHSAAVDEHLSLYGNTSRGKTVIDGWYQRVGSVCKEHCVPKFCCLSRFTTIYHGIDEKVTCDLVKWWFLMFVNIFSVGRSMKDVWRKN